MLLLIIKKILLTSINTPSKLARKGTKYLTFNEKYL